MDAFDRQYWDSDRASYEDELNAWRERTAFTALTVPVATAPQRRARLAPRPTSAAHETRLDRTPLRRSSRRAGARRLPRVHVGMRD